jgi:hypothetical protein
VIELDIIRRRPYIVALTAGGLCYIYSGFDRGRVLDRARAAEFVMIGANLDTELTWLQPGHVHETYQRLCEAVGFRNVHLMEDTS